MRLTSARREHHVPDGVVLALLAVEDRADAELCGIESVATTGPNTPKPSKLLPRVHCGNVGSVE